MRKKIAKLRQKRTLTKQISQATYYTANTSYAMACGLAGQEYAGGERYRTFITDWRKFSNLLELSKCSKYVRTISLVVEPSSGAQQVSINIL